MAVTSVAPVFAPGSYRRVAGVAGATRYPTNHIGGGDATNTNSILSGYTGTVTIVGIFISVAATAATSVVDHDGADITGCTITPGANTNVGFFQLNVPYQATGTGASNIGIKCGAGVTAMLIYQI